MGSLLRLLFELSVDLAAEKIAEVQRKRAAARQWARTPAPVRACGRCKEIAYIPGQAECAKCGASLGR
jgi:hypothetical protein